MTDAADTPTTPSAQPEPITCEAVLFVDADGSWTICDDQDDHDDRIGAAQLIGVHRSIPIRITIRPPTLEPAIELTVPDASGTLAPATAEVA